MVYERNVSDSLGINESDVWSFTAPDFVSTKFVAAYVQPVVVILNPVLNKVIIKGECAGLKKIEVYNPHGQEFSCLTKIIRNNKQQIVLDVSTLRPGIYFIKTGSTINKINKQ
jgi:hypothetical protein